MEKLINFTTKASPGPLKNVVGKSNMGYYSEQEVSREETPQSKAADKKEESKQNKFGNIRLRGGYETEDSDDSLTPDPKLKTCDQKSAKGMSQFFIQKGSQTAKQH